MLSLTPREWHALIEVRRHVESARAGISSGLGGMAPTQPKRQTAKQHQLIIRETLGTREAPLSAEDTQAQTDYFARKAEYLKRSRE